MDGFEPLEGARPASKRGQASARKGATGEREVMDAIRTVMVNVETELQTEGMEIVGRSTDVVRRRLQRGKSREDISGVPLISIEVKRNETLNVAGAWAQCCRQADNNRLPVLLYRFNREPWRVRTWVALTSPSSAVLSYAVGDISMPDFLSYFARLYRDFLIANA